jgi:hypothetical protein
VVAAVQLHDQSLQVARALAQRMLRLEASRACPTGTSAAVYLHCAIEFLFVQWIQTIMIKKDTSNIQIQIQMKIQISLRVSMLQLKRLTLC